MLTSVSFLCSNSSEPPSSFPYLSKQVSLLSSSSPSSSSRISFTLSSSAFPSSISSYSSQPRKKNQTREGQLLPFICCSLPSSFSGPSSSTMSACNGDDPRIDDIKSKIRVVPNFPKPGIMFQDITTLLLDPKAFKDTIDLFVERYKDKNISVVAGIEARGFIFGPPIALAIGAKFVPLRKPEKLPGEVISEEYVLEYGRDCIQMHVGAVEPGDRALVVDDLVATGGTLCAAMNLLERAGAEVVECACLIELPDLKDELADLLTKTLPGHTYDQILSKLVMTHLYSSFRLKCPSSASPKAHNQEPHPGRERLKGKPLYMLVEAY